MDSSATTDTFAAAPDPAAAPRSGRSARLAVRLASLLGFVAVLGYFAVAAPGFLSLGNAGIVVEQSAILGILAFGMTIVMIGGGSNVITGGIDLSLANNLGLCVAVYAVAIAAGHSDGYALALTLAVGLLVGAVNALAVVGLGVLPLLATLATMNICAGAELVLTQNTVVSAASPVLAAINGRHMFGVSIPVLALGVVAIVLIAAVHYTPAGLRLGAVGAQREAARASGIRVRAYLVATYLASGLCGALAAILAAARLSGSSPGSGDLLLPVVVAALLGVVFSRRLVPTIGGTLLSALFIGFLANGFQLINVSSYWVNGVQGVLILLVVSVTTLSRGREI